MNSFIFKLLVISFLYSCNTGIKNDTEQGGQTIDTIKVEVEPIATNQNSNNPFFHNYYNKFGVMIQDYYSIKDSLPIDINSDGLIDTIVVLSPITLEQVEYYNKDVTQTPKRIMVEIINHGDYSTVRNKYSNLISDIPSVLSKYNGLKLTDNGFKIIHESGSRYSWVYEVELSTEFPDSLTLLKIEKECSYDGSSSIKEYSYNNSSVKNINISDTIKLNCNCDSLWENLENPN